MESVDLVFGPEDLSICEQFKIDAYLVTPLPRNSLEKESGTSSYSLPQSFGTLPRDILKLVDVSNDSKGSSGTGSPKNLRLDSYKNSTITIF